MKKAIRYLRFSQIGQSNGSIERQELYTDQWLSNNNVELVDTFIDRGKSARTFDRPDFIKLQEFISKHYSSVDYLLVDQMDRFSRDAGEAMSMVKALQKRYGIQVVSVTEGITFDYDTPGSFFRAGLQLLLAEEDNINRSIKIRGGLYTARAKEGRYIATTTPYGYMKVGERKERHLEVKEDEAKVIKYIYDSYLRDVPIYIIREKAWEMGYKIKGKMAIEKVLTSPVYAGMLLVQPYKEHPGGLFPAIHEAIIDKLTWNMVQAKIKRPVKERSIIDDAIPLRGVLKCHCNKPLTGAASRGKSGKYFYYYKCNESKHNNISAIKAHNQLLSACELMSLPNIRIKQIEDGCQSAIEKELSIGKTKLRDKKRELEELQENKYALEEKWIKNQISKDTYDRWSSNYSSTETQLKMAIDRFSTNHGEAFDKLKKNLHMLADMKWVYSVADTLQKREFINMVFDSNLYYQDGIYRTPTMMDVLSCNHLLMREKGLLVYEKKGGDLSITPTSGVGENRTIVL